YTGTVQVIVKPMPIFTAVAPVPVYAYATTTSDDVTFDGLDQMQFDFSAVSDYMPTLTFAVNGLSCVSSLTNTDDMTCDDGLDALPPATYPAHLIFENKFQKIDIQIGLYLTP